jgi:hypothetical protein
MKKSQVTERDELNGLSHEVFQLKLEWDCFKQLFMYSNERSAILYKAIPNLAETLKIAVAYNIVTTIYRLTDKRGDVLTLSTMVDRRAGSAPKLVETMLKLSKACDKIRRFRHKLVAHRDNKVATGEMSVNVPELRNLQSAVHLIEEVVVQLGMEIDGGYLSFGNATVEHNVHWLIACLAFGQRNLKDIVEIKQKWVRGAKTEHIKRRRQNRKGRPVSQKL